MEDIYGSGTGEGRSYARRPADVVSVHENAHEFAQLACLVPELESEAWVAHFEHVEEVLDRIGLELLISLRSKPAEPTIEVDSEPG